MSNAYPPPALAVKSRAEFNIANSSDTGVRVGLGVRVGAGVGVMTGALVGIGMLEADTGPATGVLVGAIGVGVSVGATVGVGTGAGSCPQATPSASISTTGMMASVVFILKNFAKGLLPTLVSPSKERGFSYHGQRLLS